jgi:hypothetical protein
MAHIIADNSNIYQLLAEAKKGERNNAQNFNFRGIDAVINAVAPVFNELGIIVVPEVTQTQYDTVEIGQRKTPMSHVVVEVKYAFYGPQGDSVVAAVAAEAMDSGDKAVAKAMSVAMRIALLQTLNLPTDEPDPDSVSYERSGSSPVAQRGIGTAPKPESWTDTSQEQIKEIMEQIVSAESLNDVRVAWKSAGALGLLQSNAVLADGEKIKIQDLLYRKKDSLEKAEFPEGA